MTSKFPANHIDEMNQPPTVFDWLDEVRKRPAMRVRSVEDLHSQVHGYYTALNQHGIYEPVPNMNRKFNDWAKHKTGWQGFNCGWGYAFDLNTPENEDALQSLFTYVDEYRLLRPTVVAKVTLTPDSQPTGKRRKSGNGTLMDRPDKISIIHYAPTDFYHLRFHYDSRQVDDYFLNNELYCFEWVSDEFELPRESWESMV